MIVGCGSAVGAVIRYLMTILWKRKKIDWPLATLFINISGAALLAWLSQWLLPSSNANLFWSMGVLGGYTTFSTLNTELIGMYRQRAWAKLWTYLILTYAGGIIAVWLFLR